MRLWIISGSFFISDQSLPNPYITLAILKQFTLNICRRAGVSARSRSSQEEMWVGFKYQAAGQRQVLGASAAQVMHLNRTAATAPHPAVFWTQWEPRASALQLHCTPLAWFPAMLTHFSRATTYLAAGMYSEFHIFRLMCRFWTTEGQEVQKKR